MMEALAMGNYGAYVWSCYGLTLIVLVVCSVQARLRHNDIINSVKIRLSAMETQE